MLDFNKLKPEQGALFPIDPQEEDKREKEASEKRYKEKKDHVKKFGGGRRYGKGAPPISKVRDASKWLSNEEKVELAKCIRLAKVNDKNFMRVGFISKLDVERKTDKSLKVNGIWFPISQSVRVISGGDTELHVKDWFVTKNRDSFRNNFGLGV